MMPAGKVRMRMSMSTGILEGTANGRHWRLVKPIETGDAFIPGRYAVSAPVERKFFGLVSAITFLDEPGHPPHMVTQFRRDGQCAFPSREWEDFMLALQADGGGELIVTE